VGRIFFSKNLRPCSLHSRPLRLSVHCALRRVQHSLPPFVFSTTTFRLMSFASRPFLTSVSEIVESVNRADDPAFAILVFPLHSNLSIEIHCSSPRSIHFSPFPPPSSVASTRALTFRVPVFSISVPCPLIQLPVVTPARSSFVSSLFVQNLFARVI